MGSRHWQALALAGLTAFAVACGGDQADEQPAMEMDMDMDQSGMMDDEPAAQTGQETMQEPQDLPEGVTMEMVEEGGQLFTGQGICHSCHNPEATGTQLAPDLTDDEWLNVSGREYDEIVSLIRTGVPEPVEHPGPMPPMGGANLSDAQIEALAAYIVTLGG